MSPEEIKQLAYELWALEQANKEQHGDFHIPPEEHYIQHTEIKDVVVLYKDAKGYFWKAFFGLAVVGSIALAAWGAIISLPKH
jgi:hypothetical protein